MRFPLLVLAASFVSLYRARGFVLSGFSLRNGGPASPELQRAFSRGITSSGDTTTAMKRRAVSGRGGSPLAMSDRLTVGRERGIVKACASFRCLRVGRCLQRGSRVYMILLMFASPISTYEYIPGAVAAVQQQYDRAVSCEVQSTACLGV